MKKAVNIILLVIAITLLPLSTFACSRETNQGNTDRVTIGTLRLEVTALITIADHQKLFKKITST